MVSKNKIVYILFILSIHTSLKAQQTFKKNTFFSAEINADSGLVSLTGGFIDTVYYADLHYNVFSKVAKGKFKFTPNVSYPYAFRLALIDSNLGYYSGMFFLEKGNQFAKFNTNATKISPVITGSKSNDEYLNIFLLMNEQLIKRENDLRIIGHDLNIKYEGRIPDSISAMIFKARMAIEHSKDSILKAYSIQHHNSYVALWQLIERVTIFGYTPLYLDVFNNLSKTVKKTFPGKILNEKLKQLSSNSATGGKIPRLDLTTENNDQIQFSEKSLLSKYTLIEFWFSRCNPCIQQFSRLKSIYSKYQRNILEIVGISVDKTEEKEDWKKTIQKYELPWIQYLDINERSAKKLGINSYPSNFLLDSNGKIVAKNITPEDLDKFLKE